METDTKRQIQKWELIGIAGAGAILHFAFEWSSGTRDAERSSRKEA
jgi:hypothetical protein